MQLFNKTERDLRKLDDVKIARTFVCSKFSYGADSRQREINADFHPPIGQTEDGRYVTVDGVEIDEDTVPQYIIEAGPPPPPRPMAEREDVTLEDFMKESMGLRTPGTVYQQSNGAFTADLQGKIRLKVVSTAESAKASAAPAKVKRGPGRPRKAT